MKRKWLHELPYLLIALYATKIGRHGGWQKEQVQALSC